LKRYDLLSGEKDSDCQKRITVYNWRIKFNKNTHLCFIEMSIPTTKNLNIFSAGEVKKKIGSEMRLADEQQTSTKTVLQYIIHFITKKYKMQCNALS
jgi:hypothetical protein